MTDKYELKYSGIGRLYGRDAMRKLSSSHVCVVGVGGVGSWCVEALVRSGVGEITLMTWMMFVSQTSTGSYQHLSRQSASKRSTFLEIECFSSIPT